jgi:hypothetical protein
MSVLTKKLKLPSGEDDFLTVIRGTKILHGDFLVTEEDSVKWGSYKFGKPDGPICKALSKRNTILLQNFKNGKVLPDEIITVNENENGVPFLYVEMHNNGNGYDHIKSYRAAKSGNVTLQKVLTTEVSSTKIGNLADPETTTLIYEPTIGGTIYPTVVNTFKDIEVGKVYTRWYRTTLSGKMLLVAIARSSAEEALNDNSADLGFRTTIDEIVVLPEDSNTFERFPSSNPTSDEKFETFKSSKFGTVEYEKIKSEMTTKWLTITCQKDGSYTGSAKASEQSEEITINIGRENVDLVLFDLQRGSGSGVEQVRNLILTHLPTTGEGEVSGSSAEDIQCAGKEAPNIPDGNQDGVGCPDQDCSGSDCGS